jgi:hypothetical protein
MTSLQRAYFEKGWTCLPGFLEHSAVDAIATDVAWLVETQMAYVGMKVEHPHDPVIANLGHNLGRLESAHPGIQACIYDEVNRLPSMHALAASAPLLSVAKEILGERVGVHPRLNMIMALPEDEWHLGTWHQDGLYGPSNHLVSYIPLQRTDASNGGLVVATGMHARGLLPHAVREEWGIDTKFYTLEPDEVASFPERRQLELEAGDLLLFDRYMPHTANINRSSFARFAITIRYVDLSDPFFASRRWKWQDLAEAGLTALAHQKES